MMMKKSGLSFLELKFNFSLSNEFECIILRVKFGECFCTIDLEQSKELIENNNNKIKGEA